MSVRNWNQMDQMAYEIQRKYALPINISLNINADEWAFTSFARNLVNLLGNGVSLSLFLFLAYSHTRCKCVCAWVLFSQWISNEYHIDTRFSMYSAGHLPSVYFNGNDTSFRWVLADWYFIFHSSPFPFPHPIWIYLDTFASKVAAIQDKYADASVGNVTGSNAVNVFLGIGVAWTIGITIIFI